MDFSKVKIACSSLPDIMSSFKINNGLTDNQKEEYKKLLSKEKRTDKQQLKYEEYCEKISKEGEIEKIGKAAISKFKDIYIKEKWDKQVISSSKDYTTAILNGTLSESNSRKLLSEIDGVEYNLHKKLISNRYLKGILDCYLGKSPKKATKVTDIKTSPSMQALLGLLKDEESRSKYYWQMMGYLAITGAAEGEVCHCLVTYPERIINDEINKFLARVKNLGMDGEYIDSQIHRIKSNLTFDEIPPEQRIVRFKIERDEDAIKQIYDRVKFCRNWLNEFDISFCKTNY